MRKGWEYKSFETCINKLPKAKQVKTSEYSSGTKYPIISQEDKLISGYYDDESYVFHIDSPVVIFGDHTRVLKYIDFDFVVGADGVKIISPQKDLNAKFLLYYLQWYKIPNLGYSRHYKLLREIKIPLPPQSTQLAIVSELDKINELIRLKKEQLKDFDNLAQSLFYEMFGDPVENEKGWEAKKLGDVCTDIKYGTSKPASENGRYTYLRMCNLTTDGFLDLSNTKQIDIPDDEIEKCIVRYGDILFNRTNSIELVGKTCLFDKKEPMVIAGYIIRVRLNDTLLPVVLSRMFNLASIKKLLRSMAKGAVNQANINSKELASIRIPLPPLSLQRLFAQRIEQIEREKSEVQKSIQDFETLLASRIQYWFE